MTGGGAWGGLSCCLWSPSIITEGADRRAPPGEYTLAHRDERSRESTTGVLTAVAGIEEGAKQSPRYFESVCGRGTDIVYGRPVLFQKRTCLVEDLAGWLLADDECLDVAQAANGGSHATQREP